MTIFLKHYLIPIKKLQKCELLAENEVQNNKRDE